MTSGRRRRKDWNPSSAEPAVVTAAPFISKTARSASWVSWSSSTTRRRNPDSGASGNAGPLGLGVEPPIVYPSPATPGNATPLRLSREFYKGFVEFAVAASPGSLHVRRAFAPADSEG